MTNNYSATKVKQDFQNRRISKRVAKIRLSRSDFEGKPQDLNPTLKSWATERSKVTTC